MKHTFEAPENDLLLSDGIRLAGDSPGVIRDRAGVPVEWTLLRIGDNPITRNGQDGSITLSADDMQSIVDYHTAKGELIPVDSNHYLHELATSKQLDETEVLKLLPSGVAAMGFGSLALAGDELRFRVKWTPTAYELMKEKIFRYFSPALRGLARPPLRLTSVAMENEPAINHLDALAASARNQPPVPGNNHRRVDMTRLDRALSRLTGRDAVALSDCEDETKKDALAAAVEEKADLIGELRKSLKLSEEVTDDAIVEALKGVIAKAGSAEALTSELAALTAKVDDMAASADRQKRESLIAQGKREGKITPANLAIFEALDTAALAAHLPGAPVIVPLARLRREDLPKPDATALSAEDNEVIRTLGLDAEKYKAMKQAKGY